MTPRAGAAIAEWFTGAVAAGNAAAAREAFGFAAAQSTAAREAAAAAGQAKEMSDA